jgi:hypothetical protein
LFHYAIPSAKPFPSHDLSQSKIAKRYDPYDFRPVSVEVVEGAIGMVKKTRFEQVSLEVVKKVVEEQAKREETTESGRGTKKEELEQVLLAIGRANGKGRKK